MESHQKKAEEVLINKVTDQFLKNISLYDLIQISMKSQVVDAKREVADCHIMDKGEEA